jgi:hypothetical protein
MKMNTTRFFRLVWRINGLTLCLVIVLGLLAAVVGLIAMVVSEIARPRSKSDTLLTQTEARQSDWRLGSFAPLAGAETLYAGVTLAQEFGSSGSYRSKETSATCNYLFVRTTDKSSHFLLPDNKSILTELRPLRVGGSDSEGTRVEWLYGQRIVADTNKDDRLDHEDGFSVGFARPDGTDYQDVLTGIDAVLGETRRGPNTFLLVFRQKKSIQIAEMDIPSRKVIVTRPLPALGN